MRRSSAMILWQKRYRGCYLFTLREGYPFAQIAHATTSKDDLILLKFSVSGRASGLRQEKSLSVGNTLPDKSLKEIMSLKEGKIYNAGIIDTDRETLKNFYDSLGYLSSAD